MGQKSTKSNDFLSKEFDPTKIINEITSNCSSSSSSTSSRSKSNHDSAISNDSGCYSGLDNTEKCNDSGSSVLCLFDSIDNKNLPQGKLKNSDELKISEKTKNLLNIKSDMKSRLFKIENYLFLNGAKLEPENKHKIRPSSACDSLLFSCSLSSSSNTGLNNDEIMPATCNESEDCNKKAQLLCDQLNKILNISTCLASESKTKTQISQIGSANQNNLASTLTKSKNNGDKFSNNKTINFCKFSNMSPGSNFSSSSFAKKNTYLFKSKLVNRSYTFHANNFKYENEELNDNSVKPEALSQNKDIIEEELENKIANSKNKLSNYIFKSGRRLLSWNANSQRLRNFQKRQFIEKDCDKKLKPSNIYKSEEKIVNLIQIIAAKLMSENIELSKAPYTDEVKIFLLDLSNSLNNRIN